MSGHDNPIPISDTDVSTANNLRSRKSALEDETTITSSSSTTAQRPASKKAAAEPNHGHPPLPLGNGIESDRQLEQQAGLKNDGEVKDDHTDFFMLPTLNVNRYASKKTLAQGMLDLALLAANAGQLKFILTAGAAHPFYTLLLVLVSTSICLQVLQVIICIVLGLILDISKVDQQRKADICNDVCVIIIVIVVALNVVISAFDMRASTALRAFVVNV